MSSNVLRAGLSLVLVSMALADLNAEQIDLSIQLMQALGGGFEPGNTAAAVPTQASLAQ